MENVLINWGALASKLKATFSSFLYYGFLLAIGLVLLLLLSLVKARTLFGSKEAIWLVSYTIFVTSFELSRVLGAALYRKSINNVMDHADLLISRRGEHFEPKISFVIPCKNEGQEIANTITKCFEADYPADKFEVIVINDGSTDNTGQVIALQKKKYGDRLKVISWKKNRGKRQGMAAGFKLAKGEIIIQLDSDSYIEPSTFRNFIKPFAHEDIGAVCAHADPANADKNLLTKLQAGYYFMSFRILKSAESVLMSVFCCSGCSSAYRKSVVMPILDDWLNEKFLGSKVTWGDDRALTNWVIKRGFKTIYTDKAKAYTVVPERFNQFVKQQVRWKKSWIINAIFASKFIIKKRPFVAFIYFFPLIFVSLLTPIVAIRALIYDPIFTHQIAYYYLFGILLLTSIMVVFYRIVDKTNKYWPYLFGWAAINTIFLSYFMLYAAATIQNRKWGTR